MYKNIFLYSSNLVVDNKIIPIVPDKEIIIYKSSGYEK